MKIVKHKVEMIVVTHSIDIGANLKVWLRNMNNGYPTLVYCFLKVISIILVEVQMLNGLIEPLKITGFTQYQ